ncbi:MAG: hypothetical protein KC457_12985 [Myxococcales bacterium]|nr:hypothetical protein [Myxococcales bacterium]
MTLAISPDGVNFFIDTIIDPTMLSALQTMTAPDTSFCPDNYTQTGIQAGPYSYPDTTTYSNIEVQLTQGTLRNFVPVYQGYEQLSGGVFRLTYVANNVTADYSWHETYQKTVYDPNNHKTTGPTNESATYDFTIGIGSITVTIELTLSATSSEYSLRVTSTSASPQNLSPNWPSDSVVVTSNSCTGTTVDNGTNQAIQSIDFNSAAAAVLDPLFGSVSTTGDLGNGISFDWEAGDTPLGFPDDAGVTIGITGQVSYEGVGYSGQTPPSLALASMPTDNYAHFDVADYEFNALNWGFFSAGLLNQTIVAGDLPDPGVLNTSYYKNVFPALYQDYPNFPMYVDVTPTAAPTVVFQLIYELSQSALDTLAAEGVPDAVITQLGYLVNTPYLSQNQFETTVSRMIGSDSWATYGTQIEAAAESYAGVFSHQVNAVFYVASTPAAYVFTVQYDVTYIESAFVLGISDSNQTVQFTFTIVDSETTATLVDTAYPANHFNFAAIWTQFQTAYDSTMAALGQQGVPLPYMQGFAFLLSSATVTVQQAMVSVLTNLEYDP